MIRQIKHGPGAEVSADFAWKLSSPFESEFLSNRHAVPEKKNGETRFRVSPEEYRVTILSTSHA
jgi:hypothetical protein